MKLNQRLARIELQQLYVNNVIERFEDLVRKHQIMLAEAALQWVWVNYADVVNPRSLELVYNLVLELSFLNLPVAQEVLGVNEAEAWHSQTKAILLATETASNNAKRETNERLAAVDESKQREVQSWKGIIFGGYVDHFPSDALADIIMASEKFCALLDGERLGLHEANVVPREALFFDVQLLDYASAARKQMES